MAELVLKEESYRIIGICMEVHRELGMGFREIIYKDAIEYELSANSIPYWSEKQFLIHSKDVVLPRHFNADFIIFDKIVLEVKTLPFVNNCFVKQTINYLKSSNLKLGIIANFGEKSFNYKRVVF